LMASQIAKAKGDTGPAGGSSSGKKYQRNSETEAQRKAAYEAELARLQAAREEKAAAKRKREDDAAAEAKAREEKRSRLAEESRRRREEREAGEERARRARLGLPELPGADETAAAADEADEDSDGEKMDDGELRRRLRELGQPAVLFGEARAARRRRYRRLTAVVTAGPIPTTLALVEEKDMKVPDKAPKDKAGRKYLYRQLASYFTMVLREWEAALDKERRDTAASKAAYNAMVQSKETMKPVRTNSEQPPAPPTPLPTTGCTKQPGSVFVS